MKKFLAALAPYWLVVLVVVLILVGASGYFAGYRVDQAGVTRVGNLVLTGIPGPSIVYIDQTRRLSVNAGTTTVALSPGTHSVIVDAKGNDPWNEIFQIAPAADTRIAPLIIPTPIDKKIVTGADQTKANALIRAAKLPTKFAPLALNNGCALVYASGNRVIAEGSTTPSCTPPSYLACPGVSAEDPTGECAPTIIFSPGVSPSAIMPFPGRSDALVVWAGTTIYVVELDPREPQFIAPVFKGAISGAAPWSATSVVVTNGTEVVELPL